MKCRKRLAAAALAAVMLTSGISASAAGIGSASDPLISRSYLENVFTAKITAQVQTMLSQREANLMKKIESQLEAYRAEATSASQGSSTYRTVTMSRGQTLTGSAGLEVLPRTGTVICLSDSAVGLVDITGGGEAMAGEILTTNHLYMATAKSYGVQAATDGVTLLVRGSYTVR